MREYKGTQRAAEKQVARERIIEAAARAIRCGGYDSPSVSEIMKEAELTHGTFYAHFDSKEALLAATARIREMIEVVAQEWPESAEAIARQQAIATVCAMVGSLILARAVDDAALSEEIRTAALAAYSPPSS